MDFGPACDANQSPSGASTRNDPRPQKGDVEYGGEGIYECLKPGTVAITYDDGPYIYTDEVLNKFKAAGFKATFFVTGNNLGKGAIDQKWTTVIKRMIALRPDDQERDGLPQHHRQIPHLHASALLVLQCRLPGRHEGPRICRLVLRLGH
jgi:hypothetical protein